MKKPSKVQISGKVEIKVNGLPFSTVTAQDSKITIFINDTNYIKSAIKRAGLNMKSVERLGKLSEFLHKIGIGVNIRDSKGSFLQLGFGAYSKFVKVRVSAKRLMELFL